MRIEVRGRWERKKFGPTAFDTRAKGGPGQEGDLVAFGEQDARDRKQRIEMARRGRRSEENFHGNRPLMQTRCWPARPAGRSNEQRQSADIVITF